MIERSVPNPSRETALIQTLHEQACSSIHAAVEVERRSISRGVRIPD
jgi:hypothetical protein